MRVLKYSLIAIALFFVVAVGFFFYSISQLPDPIAIKQKVIPQDLAVPQNAVQKEILDEVAVLSEEIQEADPVSSPNKVPLTERSSIPSHKLSELINEDYSDIRVCENLSKPATEITNESVFDSMSGNHREDSNMEAFRISFKHIFQSKPVKELFAEIEQIDSPGLEGAARTDYLKKVGFYAVAAKKAYEIYSNKSEYEEVGDRSYHLYVLSKLAHEKPELALDKNVLDFCHQLETSIGEKTKIDIEEERKELLKVIEYAGLTPKALGFNPEVRTEFNLEMKDKSITFGLTSPGMQ